MDRLDARTDELGYPEKEQRLLKPGEYREAGGESESEEEDAPPAAAIERAD